MHCFALDIGALFLLDLSSGMGSWVEVYEVIVSTSEVDTCDVLGVEVFRVRPQHSV